MNRSKLIDRLVGYLRRAKTQEQIIKYLRTLKFEFILYESLHKLYPKVYIRESHQKYQFMIRRARNTLKGFDVRLLIGIKINGRKVDRILIYIDGSFSSLEAKPWAKKVRMNFKKLTMRMKFGVEMTYKERKIWRSEHEKLKKNPNLKPSEFYEKNKKYVQFL